MYCCIFTFVYFLHLFTDFSPCVLVKRVPRFLLFSLVSCGCIFLICVYCCIFTFVYSCFLLASWSNVSPGCFICFILVVYALHFVGVYALHFVDLWFFMLCILLVFMRCILLICVLLYLYICLHFFSVRPGQTCPQVFTFFVCLL